MGEVTNNSLYIQTVQRKNKYYAIMKIHKTEAKIKCIQLNEKLHSQATQKCLKHCVFSLFYNVMKEKKNKIS